MNLYLVERTDSYGYGDYVHFVVACANEEEARSTKPIECPGDNQYAYGWTKPDNVTVTLIGQAEAGLRGIICSHYVDG